jgi:hypothetical protein
MYRNCIYCSADFGTNEAVGEFPVGRQLAFDGWQGRLWAVCPGCGRWNLSPIEERWEAVEHAEQLFRDARLRVQSENVGLAKLPDGTRLVRVGKALPGELAAWRYGSQLVRRRKRYLITSIGAGAAVATAYTGLQALGVGSIFAWIGYKSVKRSFTRRVVHHVPPEDSPDGKGITIRRWHVPGLRLLPGIEPGDVQLEIRDAHLDPTPRYGEVDPMSKDLVVLTGPAARAALSRAMVRVNRQGATTARLEDAERLLIAAGSAAKLIRDAALRGSALGHKAGPNPQVVAGPGALAFEMALHEEAERQALEGELSALDAAWRRAEEIAAIADKLPGEEALDRLVQRLIR